jgi:hypothetical protein
MHPTNRNASFHISPPFPFASTLAMSAMKKHSKPKGAEGAMISDNRFAHLHNDPVRFGHACLLITYRSWRSCMPITAF